MINSNIKPMIKPKRLKPGNTIAIVSPSSGIWERRELSQSIEALESMGYHVKLGDHALKRHYYLAGSDEQRAEDLMWAFSDDTVDAIFASQGGYGAARLLKHLDFDMIHQNPKIFMGYSDITSLHLAIAKETGLVTFHGPSALSFGSEAMTPYRMTGIQKAIMLSTPIGVIKRGSLPKAIVKLNGGTAEGALVGGNLSLVCATLGTPWEIDTRGKVLFLEDIEVEPWQMDHLLTHMMNAGKFEDAAAIVIGECKACEPFEHRPGFPNQCSLENLIYEFFEGLEKPVLYGFPIGHTKDLATLPMGVRARVNADDGVFEVIEAGVCD
jgi:muramoyltetrapeptide carboxypeptidase